MINYGPNGGNPSTLKLLPLCLMTIAENHSGYINTTEILKHTKRLSSELAKGDNEKEITHFSIVELTGKEGRELVFGDRKIKVPRTASIKPEDLPVAEEEKLDALSSFACIALEQVPKCIYLLFINALL